MPTEARLQAWHEKRKKQNKADYCKSYNLVIIESSRYINGLLKNIYKNK